MRFTRLSLMVAAVASMLAFPAFASPTFAAPSATERIMLDASTHVTPASLTIGFTGMIQTASPAATFTSSQRRGGHTATVATVTNRNASFARFASSPLRRPEVGAARLGGFVARA